MPFVVGPQTRFVKRAGEKQTCFVRAPFGYVLEFKSLLSVPQFSKKVTLESAGMMNSVTEKLGIRTRSLFHRPPEWSLYYRAFKRFARSYSVC